MDNAAKLLQQKLLRLSEQLENFAHNEQQAKSLKHEIEDVLNDIKIITANLDERT